MLAMRSRHDLSRTVLQLQGRRRLLFLEELVGFDFRRALEAIEQPVEKQRQRKWWIRENPQNCYFAESTAKGRTVDDYRPKQVFVSQQIHNLDQLKNLKASKALMALSDVVLEDGTLMSLVTYAPHSRSDEAEVELAAFSSTFQY